MKRSRALSPGAAFVAAIACAALWTLLRGADAFASEPGGLIVTDAGENGSLAANGSVIAIDPDTGVQTRITSGGSLYNPTAVVVDASGDLLVADPVYGVGGSVSARVVRIDGETGIQTRTIRDRLIEGCQDLVLAKDGGIVVLQYLARQPLVRIDPANERVTALIEGPPYSLGINPGLSLGPDGELYVTDTFDERILKIVPDLPSHYTPLVPEDGLLEPVGIALGPNGLLYVASTELRAVYSVDPKTGAMQLVSSFGLLQWPFRVAVAASGMLYVVDPVARAIIAIHPVTGEQTLVSTGGLLVSPTGIAVAPGGIADADGDTILDAFDSCPQAADLGQGDADGDGRGDACDRFPDEPDDLARCVDLRDASAGRVAELEAEHASLSAAAQARVAEQTALLADRSRLLAIDSDGDGRPDVLDRCPGTRPSARVDAQGCDASQRRLLRLVQRGAETLR